MDLIDTGTVLALDGLRVSRSPYTERLTHPKEVNTP